MVNAIFLIENPPYFRVVFSFSDIFNRIVPFFAEHNIIGEKAKDFDDFCLVANLIKDKSHLTSEGLDRIRDIKANMRSS